MTRFNLPSQRALLVAVAALAASSISVGASSAQAPAALSPVQRTYVDPVSAAVAEASRRFGVPEAWIWSVMRVESAGNARAVSHAGAIGLMQVMPGTYAELRARYGLGPNSFDVRDNILAGTAYLREMHDRYGVQGMLAAYNAGPARWEAYVRVGRRLPAETIGYLARLAPEVGAAGLPMTAEVEFVRTSHAPRPTLFVQLLRTTAAAASRAERRSLEAAAVAVASAPEPPESVFVHRGSSDLRTSVERTEPSGDPAAISGSPTANPLFVPIRTAPDRS